MVIEDTKPCANPPCKCRITAGTSMDFCSQYCQSVDPSMEGSCGCGHTHCDTTGMSFSENPVPVSLH